MIGTLLVLAIGASDLTRSLRGRLRSVAAAAVLLGVALLGLLGLSLAPAPVAVVVALAIAWSVLMPRRSGPRGRSRAVGLWPVLVLVVVLAGSLAVGGSPAATVPLVDAYDQLLQGSGSALRDVPFEVAFAVLAVVVFLLDSANVVVRVALGPVVRRAEDEPEGRTAWRLRWGRRVVGSVERPSTPASAHALRGGRLIGPLERLLIVVLTLSGMHTVIAALLAAKGIVRFPEISDDRGAGSKAEEFLIGTLTSWALAAGGVLYIVALAG